jgi:phosphate-selective porin OprO/OprP
MQRSADGSPRRAWRCAPGWAAVAYAFATTSQAQVYQGLSNWPTTLTTVGGSEIGLAVLYQYDANRFAHDGGRFEDAHTNRRKYLGLYARKPGFYDAVAQYDYQARQWADAFVRVRSKGWLGVDLGNFRLGYSKTPVGFEGVTGSSATTFIEAALPTQAIWEGRRAGLDWAWVRPHYLINLGYYFWPRDLEGNNRGRTLAGRVAWMPRNRPGQVTHLGLSASREWLYGEIDGAPPSARLRARPEAGLTPLRLVDSGNLAQARYIDRRGLEALWIEGPWSLQGEYLQARVVREAGRASYVSQGYYLFASWTVTGESRYYSDGNVADRRYSGRDLQVIRPARRWGAVELALRYSRLNMNDGSIAGGIEHDWTLGANWYLGEHLKLQGNYVWAHSDRGDLQVDPQIAELRAQIFF